MSLTAMYLFPERIMDQCVSPVPSTLISKYSSANYFLYLQTFIIFCLLSLHFCHLICWKSMKIACKKLWLLCCAVKFKSNHSTVICLFCINVHYVNEITLILMKNFDFFFCHLVDKQVNKQRNKEILAESQVGLNIKSLILIEEVNICEQTTFFRVSKF